MSTTVILVISGIVALALGAGTAAFFYRRKKPLTGSLMDTPSSTDILRTSEPGPAKMLDTTSTTSSEEMTGSIPEEVVAFVAACRGQGIPDIQTKIQLLDAGWSHEAVDAALALPEV